MPASQVCVAFTQTSYIRAAGITAGDWAAGDYVSADQSQEVFEEIDVFTGTDAQKAMATLWQEFGKCSSFSYHVQRHHRDEHTDAEPGSREKATTPSRRSSCPRSSKAARPSRLSGWARKIITTLDSASGKDLGSPAVGYAEKIAQRLRAAG